MVQHLIMLQGDFGAPFGCNIESGRFRKLKLNLFVHHFKQSSMRQQVLLRSFGAPVLLAILLIIRLGHGLDPYQVFLHTAFVISILFLRLISGDKYVQTFAIRDGRIVIKYLTHFLQEKSVDLALSDISDVRLSKRTIFAVVWSPVFDLKAGGERLSFHVVSKKLYNEMQQQMASAHIAFVQ
jgi:hypothetical protein